MVQVPAISHDSDCLGDATNIDDARSKQSDHRPK